MILQFNKFSGSFEIKNGLLRYSDDKKKDFFEMPTNFVQAVRIEAIEDNNKESLLLIIGHYQVLKNIQLPTRYTEKIRLWIYLNLHLLSSDGSLQSLANQTEEYHHFENNRHWKILFSILVVLLILCGFSKSFSYTVQIEKLKSEASQYNYADLIEEGKKLISKNELDEGIHDFVLANTLMPSPLIRQMLDEAYLKRGKLFLDSDNVPLAKKNFQFVSSVNVEVKSLLAKIKEYEDKKWIHFSDVSDFVRYKFFTITYYFDGGKDQSISKEMDRTISEYQSKLDYTRKYHPFISVWKDMVIAEIY